MTLARLVASGFGSGYFPVAPGTAGSVVALLVGAGLLWAAPMALPWLVLLVAAVGGFCLGGVGGAGGRRSLVGGDRRVRRAMGRTSLALARPTLVGLAAAFLLFRLLDIAKPGPVGWADRQHNAAGVMADDLIAGAIAAGILWAAQSHWPGVLDWPW